MFNYLLLFCVIILLSVQDVNMRVINVLLSTAHETRTVTILRFLHMTMSYHVHREHS